MEIGGVISRKIAEAICVPGVRVSNTSRKPPSRYGLIQNLGHDSFSHRSNERNARKIRCKIRHVRRCPFRSFGEKTERLPSSSDRHGLSLTQLLCYLAESFLKLSSVNRSHVRHAAGHFNKNQLHSKFGYRNSRNESHKIHFIQFLFTLILLEL